MPRAKPRPSATRSRAAARSSASLTRASARQRVEAALVRSERRYRELVEYSLGLVCTHDPDGRLLFVNPAAARSLGYEPDDWRGRNLREFVAADARPLFDDYLRRIASQREDSGLLRLVDRQGQERVWMYHNVRSEDPDEPHIVGHALDITERVRAERAARRHREDLEQAYRTLDERVRSRTIELEAANQQLREEMAERHRAEAMREAVMTRERNTLSFLATAGDQLTQAPDYEATLKTLARLPVPLLADWTTLFAIADDGAWRCVGARSADSAHRPLFAQLLSLEPQVLDDACRLAQIKRTCAVVTVTAAEDGSGRSIAQDLFGPGQHLPYLDPLPCRSALAVPLLVDDRVLAVLTLGSAALDRYQASDLVVVNDLVRRCQVALTQVRLYREAHEANRLKDEFLATLSHELRTPLNAMLGWARILRSRSLDEKTDHAVQVIERNAEAQARLIEDVLDVSRIITGKLNLEVEPVHLPAVVLAALDSIRPAAAAKGIRLIEQLEPSSTVGGDRHRLQQVIWNLLSNAVKFTNTGGSVTVSLRDVGESVEIAVSDTGMGIRREVLPFVFDRFRQADPSTTRNQTGLGLGLAIVRHLVELHGGTVRVRSLLGQGTTFFVELPARKAVAGELPTGQMVLGGGLLLGTPDQPLRDVHALVVDDHEDARELATAVLQSAGARVVTAASVPEALSVYARDPVQVLVADIGLPGRDGCELIRTLRAHKDASGLVAIALTGYARAEDRVRALEAGFDRHVVKPAEPAALVMLVRELLDRA